MISGLYEQIINKLVLSKLNDLNKDSFYIKETPIDKIEASRTLSQYLFDVIQFALSLITGDDSIEKQIELSNKIILLLRDELRDEEFDSDLIAIEAKILSAVFSKLDARFADFDKHLKEITPYTRLSHEKFITACVKQHYFAYNICSKQTCLCFVQCKG